MITVIENDSKRLTQAVFQITGILGMYHAELARILGVQCAEIGEMASVKKFIEINTPAWQQACLLVRFYNRLYEKYSGDEVSMCHWLRRYNNEFSDSPFYLIVDKNRLLDVTCFLESDTK